MSSAVIAGSRSFADALAAPLKLRLGASPQVASDPTALIASGAAADGLVVLEYTGDAWLEAVKDVRIVRGDRPLAIVAAVPGARMSDVAALRSAGVDEAVEWCSRMDPVLWAIDRVLAARARITPVMNRAAPDPAAPARAEEATEELELGSEETPPGDAPAVQMGPASPSSPAPEEAPLSPAELPEGLLLVQRLGAVLEGREGALEGTLGRALSRFTAQLTELERAALSGDALAVDPAAIGEAAALRFRVGVVLQHARAAGGIPDAGAASELPARLDDALMALKRLGEGAPPELQRALGATRNALVAEAIQLTEALARAAEPTRELAPVAPFPSPPVAAPAAGPARLISNENAAEAARAEAPRRRPFIALAVVLALGLGYHGWRLATQPQPTPPATLAGAPARTYAVNGPDATKIVSALAGEKTDPAEVERWRSTEALKGHAVRELAPGVWIVEPQPRGVEKPRVETQGPKAEERKP